MITERAVAHPAAVPRIRHRRQRPQQIPLLVLLQMMGRYVDAAGRVEADSVDQ
jgi:hypothetical protein